MSISNRTFQENIMKEIKIKDHKKVYSQYMINDYDLINFIDRKTISINVKKEK